MKKRKKLCFAFWGVLTLFTSSCNNTDKVDDKAFEMNPSPQFFSATTRGPIDSPDIFIGRGYNLINYDGLSIDGISIRPILDMERIQQSNAIDPTTGEKRKMSIGSIYIDNNVNHSPRIEEASELTESYFKRKISLDAKVAESEVSLEANYYKEIENKELLHCTQIQAERIYRYIYFNLSSSEERDEALNYFITDEFQKDLKYLPARRLITKYGSHLILGYKFGSYFNLKLFGARSEFSSDEMLKITAAYKENNVSVTVKELIEKNKNKLSVKFEQAGGTYLPEGNLISTYLLDTIIQQEKGRIHYNKWVESSSFEKGNFAGLRSAQEKNSYFFEDAIPLYNIIKSPLYKVKLFSGIYEASKNTAPLSYLLSNPKTFKSIQYKGQPIHISLDKYNDLRECYIRYGSFDDLINSQDLDSSVDSKKRTRWELEMHPEGTSTFLCPNSKKYLCTDLKIRNLNEDKTGLRFWGLNPLLTEKNSYTNRNNTFITPEN